MQQLKQTLAKIPILGRILMMIYRSRLFLTYLSGPNFRFLKWLFTSRETTNFTYHLTELNIKNLAAMIAEITNTDVNTVLQYIDEIQSDQTLKSHLQEKLAKGQFAFMADNEIRYGRRIGWYALVRILKAKVVIETGVDKGLGACVLTAALKRNAEEGHQGRYYGTDINPNAGYLLDGVYAEHGEILYGDSIESLKKLDVTIDLFINDSDHSATYEADEYEVIHDQLSPTGIILGDNAHVTTKLFEHSQKHNRSFLFFEEMPKDHWYPGSGIGISYSKQH